MFKTRMAFAFALTTLALAGCGGTSSSEKLVWCVAPDTTVDAQFKREYPELRMTKSECDAATAIGDAIVDELSDK